MSVVTDAIQSPAGNAPLVSSRADEVAQLVRRLEHGFDVIEQARSSGRDVFEWENTWIRMLGRYEALVANSAG